MPTDVVESNGKSSFICAAIDMFSLGCILYMMKFREAYKPDTTNIELLKESDPSLYQLINGLTDKDISQRWTMEKTEESLWLRPVYTFKIYTEYTQNIEERLQGLYGYTYTLIGSGKQLDSLYNEGKLTEPVMLSNFIKNIRDIFCKNNLTDFTGLFILEKFFVDKGKAFLYGTSFTNTEEDENIKDIKKHGFRKKIKQQSKRKSLKRQKSKRKSLKRPKKKK